MSKTGIQGMMLLVVPYMAMAFGAKQSTGVILPMLCLADIIAVAYYKRIADWKVVIRLLPTAILGFFVAILVDSQRVSTVLQFAQHGECAPCRGIIDSCQG